MKLKKLIFIFLFLLVLSISSQAVIETYLVKFVLGKITGGSSELTSIARMAITGENPTSFLTGELKNKVYADIPELGKIESGIIKVSDPAAAIKSSALNYLKKQNPALEKAITKFNSYKGMLNDISADKRPIVEIKENGETIFIERNEKEEGRELFRFGGGWDLTINKDKQEYTLTKKDSNAKDTLKINGISEVNLASGKVILSFDKETKISTIKIDGAGDIRAGGTRLQNIGRTDSEPAVIKINSVGVIEYASFEATKDQPYTFSYNNHKYVFDVKQGSSLIFDPKKNRLEGKGKTIFSFDNKIVSSEGGSFSVTLGADGNPARIDYGSNGVFIDRANIIQATSTLPFSVCIGDRKTADGFCAGKNTNLKISYEDDLNDIRSTGKIKYQIGFTTIDARENSKTTFEQTPNYNYFFQVEQGSAVVEKDAIKAEVRYQSCSKATGHIFDIYESENRCGTIVNIDRTGIPTTVTEFINIVDKDKKYGYTIGPKGGINVVNFAKKINVIGTFDKYEQNLDVANLWGSKFSSDELTNVFVVDRLIQEKERYLAAIRPGTFDKIAESINPLNFKHAPIQPMEMRYNAEAPILKQIGCLKAYKSFIQNGYPPDEAAAKSGVDPTIINVLSNSINGDGAIDIKKMIKSVEDLRANGLQSDFSGDNNVFVGLNNLNDVKFFSSVIGQQIDGEISTQINSKVIGYFKFTGTDKARQLSYNDLFNMEYELNSLVGEAKKNGQKTVKLTNFLGGKSYDQSTSVAEIENSLATIKKLKADKSFEAAQNINGRVETSELFGEAKKISMSFFTVVDIAPIGVAVNLGKSASKAIKEAGGITKFTKGAYETTSNLFNNIIKGVDPLLAVRPALILERESASLMESRGLFKEIPALASKFKCSVECAFDDAGSAAARVLNKKIANNVPGAEGLVSNLPQLTPSKLRGDLILTEISPRSIASSVSEGDLLHGTSTKKLDSILKTGYLEPSASGTLSSGAYAARVYKDTSGASNLVWGYAQRTARENGGYPVVLRIINSQGIQQTGYETVIKGGRVPLKNIEIWDPVIKKWIPATKYRIQ